MNGRVLFGTKGSINLDTMKIMSEMNGFMTDVSLVDLKSYYDTTGMFQAEINHFVDCVLNGKKPMTSGRTALESLRVIWKLYDAEKNHTVADLRDINPNSYL